MKLFAVLALILGLNGPLRAAIDAAYEGSNGIRNKVLTVCMQCHSRSVTGAARNQAPVIVNFDTYADAALFGDLAVTKAAVESSMPPSGVQPLTQEQKNALLAWAAAGFPERAAAPPDPHAKPDCLFNWAEASYPSLFAPRTQSQIATPYYFRFYPPGTYLAVAADRLLYFGPLSPSAILDLGDVSTWYPMAGCN